MIYLDNAASTPPLPHLAEELAGIAADAWANPSSAHPLGHRLRQQVERAARRLLPVAGAGDDEARVIWTSGGTEANNLALTGHLLALPSPAGIEAVTTAAEHPSVTAPLEALTASGLTLHVAPVGPDGQLDPERFAALVTPRTRLVSICLAQNETGVVQDLAAVRAVLDARAPEARLHVDAVQAFGKLPIPWRQARIDLLSVSAHKLHGPGGAGALIVRTGCPLVPILHGGGQQQNLRSGSLDTAGIQGLALAATDFHAHRQAALELATILNRQLRDGLATLTDRRGKPLRVVVNSPADASPYVLSFSLPGYQGAVLARALGQADIMVGTGSACAAETPKPSHVLTAMGVPRDVAYGTLRVSFGRQNTADDVAAFLAALRQAVAAY